MALDLRDSKRHELYATKRSQILQVRLEKDLGQPAEEEKKHRGHLRLQTYEEPVVEPFMAAKKVDPIMQREQMATDLRKNKKKEILSKKRNQHGLF